MLHLIFSFLTMMKMVVSKFVCIFTNKTLKIGPPKTVVNVPCKDMFSVVHLDLNLQNIVDKIPAVITIVINQNNITICLLVHFQPVVNCLFQNNVPPLEM